MKSSISQRARYYSISSSTSSRLWTGQLLSSRQTIGMLPSAASILSASTGHRQHVLLAMTQLHRAGADALLDQVFLTATAPKFCFNCAHNFGPAGRGLSCWQQLR